MSCPRNSASSEEEEEEEEELIHLPPVVMDAFKKYIAEDVQKKQLPVTRECHQDYVAYFKMGGFYVEMYAAEVPQGQDKNMPGMQSMRVPIMLDCTDMVRGMQWDETLNEEAFAGIYEMQLELAARHIAELKQHALLRLPREEGGMVLTGSAGDAVAYVSPSLFVCIRSGANRVPERGRCKIYNMTRGISVTRCLVGERSLEAHIDVCFRWRGSEQGAATSQRDAEWQVETFTHVRDYTDHLLAFMMGFHGRLGSGCAKDMQGVDAEVVQLCIAPLLLNPPVQILSNKDARATARMKLGMLDAC